jgi:hypothetical protein
MLNSLAAASVGGLIATFGKRIWEALAAAIDAGSAPDKAVDMLMVIDLTGKGY